MLWAQTASVQIVDFSYSPASLTVVPGTAITWTNTGQQPHTVTSTAGSQQKGLSSGTLVPGKTYTVTLTTPGTYTYFCTIHPFMTGTIVVQASAPPAPPASPTASPTVTPTPIPTTAPTVAPTLVPTTAPTAVPSPTVSQTAAPLQPLSLSVSGVPHVGHVGTLVIKVRSHGTLIRGAMVFLDTRAVGGTRRHRKTNAEGQAKFRLIPHRVGKLTVRVTKAGYKTKTRVVRVKA